MSPETEFGICGEQCVDDPELAHEMARVGAVILDQRGLTGQRIDLAGTPAIMTGEITREQFMERVRQAGLRKTFHSVPSWFVFYTISTD